MASLSSVLKKMGKKMGLHLEGQHCVLDGDAHEGLEGRHPHVHPRPDGPHHRLSLGEVRQAISTARGDVDLPAFVLSQYLLSRLACTLYQL